MQNSILRFQFHFGSTLIGSEWFTIANMQTIERRHIEDRVWFRTKPFIEMKMEFFQLINPMLMLNYTWKSFGLEKQANKCNENMQQTEHKIVGILWLNV